MNASSRTRGLVVGLLAIALLCSSVFAGVAVADTDTDTDEAENVSPDDVDVDRIYMYVEVDDSGDAHWVVEYRMLLETAEDRNTFEAVQADIEQDADPYEQEFSQYTNSVFVDATERVDRPMTLTDRTVTTREIRTTHGVVSYEFTWENFAETTETDEYRTHTIGDTMESLRLGSDTQLIIMWGTDYSMTSIQPVPDDSHVSNQVTWSGPIEFDGDVPEPRITLEKKLDAGGAHDDSNPGWYDPSPNDSGTGNGPADIGLTTIAILIAVLVVGGGLGLGALAYRRRGDDDDDAAVAGVAKGAEGEDEVETSTEATETDVSDDSEDEEEADTVDLELMSNEEQVLHLLSQNNGRMKQQSIVEETGWSPAKTSGVVNDMNDEGTVELFRLGRENIVAKPESTDTEEAVTKQ